VEANPRHAVAKAFMELADRQRRNPGMAKQAPPAKRGLFKRS